MVQLFANALSDAGLYVLLAIGFGLILTGTRIFHIAHGATITVGGYACYTISVSAGLPVYVGAAGSVLAGMLLGLVINRVVYMPLVRGRRGGPASSFVLIVSSLGAYLVISHGISLIYGTDTKVLRPGPDWTVRLAGVRVTVIQLCNMLIATATLVGLWFVLIRTRLGRLIRALADDPELVAVLGYDVAGLRAVIFGLASGLAGLAGAFTALDSGLEPASGFAAVLVAAVCCILGGVGRLLAPALGALILGVLTNLVAWYIGANWQNAAIFLLLMMTLLVRPQGILARRRRLEEQ